MRVPVKCIELSMKKKTIITFDSFSSAVKVVIIVAKEVFVNKNTCFPFVSWKSS